MRSSPVAPSAGDPARPNLATYAKLLPTEAMRRPPTPVRGDPAGDRALAPGISELRLAGWGGGPKDLRGPACGRHRSLFRPERAPGRGRLGSEDPARDPRLRALYSSHFGQHDVAPRGLLQAGVGPCGSAHAHVGAQPSVHRPRVSRCNP